MNIKSFLLTLLLALFLVPAAVNAAELPDEAMALGGIRIGDTMWDVQKIYGKGDHVADGVSKWGGTTVHVCAYDYGASLVVQYRKEGDVYRVLSVHLGVNDVNNYIHEPSDEACMIETPHGIHLDSTLEDLEAAYGYIPKANCGHTAPPVCGYFYDSADAQLAFYICGEHSPGIRSIWLHERWK